MNQSYRVTTTIVVAALGIGLSACGKRGDDCSLNYQVCGDGGASSSSTGGDGGTGGTPLECVPNRDPASAIDTSCGVFVSVTGDDGWLGTQDKPVQSFARAAKIAEGGKKTIYACAEAFDGPVELPAGLAIYGGLNCSTMPRSWQYVGNDQRTIITADADVIPLTLAKGTGTKLFDLHILAKAAVKPGGSSVAVVADTVTAEITRCVVEAADAEDGQPGEPYPISTDLRGEDGLPGTDACAMSPVSGGDAVSSTCGMLMSISGGGGNGSKDMGGPGGSGTPNGTMNGGVGASGGNPCTPGGDGAPGPAGMGGSGAIDLGLIMRNGFTGAIGMSGLSGQPGQGGGGGGGAKGGENGNGGGCHGKSGKGGASGGSGSSGGCGGAGGRGGAAGGSSIALISLNSSLSFTSAELIMGAGGKGGDGGPGQAGGLPGTRGSGGKKFDQLIDGCDGGTGGIGGTGGQGGGGRGGHSIAIAFMGTAPPKDGWTSTTGKSGDGGIGGDSAGMGTPGVNLKIQMFP